MLEWLVAQEARQSANAHDKHKQSEAVDARSKGKGKRRASVADDDELGDSDVRSLKAFESSQPTPAPTWLHCSVGAEMAEGEDEDDEQADKA